MTESYVSAIIDAPVDRIWSMLRDFGGVCAYFSGMSDARLVDDARGDQVGALRIGTLREGGKVTERLTALSDQERSFSYTFIEDPAWALANYHSTVRLRPITDGGSTFLEWSSRYDVTDGDAGEMKRFVEEEVYMECVRGLRLLAAASDMR